MEHAADALTTKTGTRGRAAFLTLAVPFVGGLLLAAWASARAQLLLLAPMEQVGVALLWATGGALLAAPAAVLVACLAGPDAGRWRRTALPLVMGLAVFVVALEVGHGAPRDPWAGWGVEGESRVADASTRVGSAPPPDGPSAVERAAAEGRRLPDLVLISVDTLRADHLELYGYGRETAPALTRWAAGGTVFERALATAPATQRSMASVLTGLLPPVFDRQHDLGEGRDPYLPAGVESLAERLAAAGYATGGFVSNAYLRRAEGFAQGFATWDETSGMFSASEAHRGRSADDILGPARAWRADVEGPAFLWVHLMDPHHPYEPREPAAWEPVHTPDWTARDGEWRGLGVGGVTERLLSFGRDRLPDAELVRWLQDRYDAEIAQVDRALAALLDELGDDALVAFVADHGEAFGEHGRWLHGHALHEELLRVPLVLRGPGVPAGQRVEAQVSLVDLAPTLLELLGLDAPAQDFDGTDLGPWLGGQRRSDRPALAVRGTKTLALCTPVDKLIVPFRPVDAGAVSGWGGLWLPRAAATALGTSRRDEVGLWALDGPLGERRRDDMARMDALANQLERLRELNLSRAFAADPAARDGQPDAEAEATLRALGYTR